MVNGADMKRLLVPAAAAVALLVLAGCGSTAGAAPQASPTVDTPPTAAASPVAPLRVVAVRPRPGASAASVGGALAVRFSAPLAASTAHPRLVPNVPGAWELRSPSTLVFRPSGHWPPLAKIRLIVPAGRAGVRGAAGSRLTRRYTAGFTIGGASTLRLQQLLADLGYLPLRFRPAATGSQTTAATGPDLVPIGPLPGHFVWRYPRLRSLLGSLWRPRVFTVLTRGAVMAFEADHGLPSDGVAGPAVWTALLDAIVRHDVARRPYDVIQVSIASPETLSVWRAGRVVYRSPANTGIAARPTAPGVYPVYARYLSTTMSGTNPDGSHYSDPGVPYVAYFNGGDAVHGFIRGSYGWPQSLGCVELPYGAASVVYGYDPIGTLVKVS